MKRIKSNILSGAVLLCVESVFFVTFWQAGSALTSLCCVLAGLGWLAWWIEYSASSVSENSPVTKGEAGAADTTPFDMPANTTLFESDSPVGAAEKTPPVMPPPAESLDVSGSAARAERPLEITASHDGSPATLAAQVRTALADSEQGITTAIEAFLKIAGDTQQMADCAGEMAHWRMEENPLMQTAVAHLLGCSQAVSDSIGSVVTAMQFQDLLRQRLEHVAASLDAMPAMPEYMAGEQNGNRVSRKQAA